MRIVHGAQAATPLIYVAVLVMLPSEYKHPIAPESSFVLILAAAMGVVAVAGLVIAHYVPQSTATQGIKLGQSPDRAVGIALVTRSAFYAAIPVYGFVLAIMGAPWTVYVPFLGVGFVALLVTFPTETYVADLVARATARPAA